MVSRSDSDAASSRTTTRSPGLLAGMRIRKKLIFLHTAFSLSLAIILLAGLRLPVREIVRLAEFDLCREVLEVAPQVRSLAPGQEVRLRHALLRAIDPMELHESTRQRLRDAPDEPVLLRHDRNGTLAGVWLEDRDLVAGALVRSDEARGAVRRLYTVLVIALLGVYALVALALEILVLPTHVYAPIRRLLRADRAVQEGQQGELIPEHEIPADELGEIMRSRNATIRKMREHEKDLAEALERLEAVAADLTRKNDLIEKARENLADADRLKSLAVMSAGLAHEMNTPLTVIKGLVERLEREPGKGLSSEESALLRRVVTRLEGLSESLLDFARVREPRRRCVRIGELLREAITLVRLDRDAEGIELVSRTPDDLTCDCDPDRILQVLVNLVRNAVDAICSSGEGGGRVEVSAREVRREGEAWISITVVDSGPGIHPSILPQLFEPFASTRLDARGTGLGLAVSQGIIREHGGVMLARNNPNRRGAVFEILLPRHSGREHADGEHD